MEYAATAAGVVQELRIKVGEPRFQPIGGFAIADRMPQQGRRW